MEHHFFLQINLADKTSQIHSANKGIFKEREKKLQGISEQGRIDNETKSMILSLNSEIQEKIRQKSIDLTKKVALFTITDKSLATSCF